jgi:lipopolysaccharide biosynthesis regulator YciM
VHYTRLVNTHKGKVFYHHLAEVYKKKHDFANAVHVYEAMLEDENNPDILVKLAMCYLELDEKRTPWKPSGSPKP